MNKLMIIALALAIISTNKFLSYTKTVNPESFTTLDSNFVKILSFGNYRFVSSYLWTKTLLDADIKHVENNEKSWLYYRFNLISDLDPNFYENYLQGGIYLSIIKDDIYGAEEIFLKGLKLFPTDYKLLYYTAFNYHFELKDYSNSLIYYKRLQALPESHSMRILPYLIKQAEERNSPTNVRLISLEREYRTSKDEKVKAAILKKIKSIKKGEP
ncbi:hypothetical protein [Halobacteriovorax sp. HFRX-2_2]|uniref:hypothetical protein n=1 Tax=unclassified Halobacteriovorax TaxID=2639665 RepID=UPI0037217669